jgi:hypothetical protein
VKAILTGEQRAFASALRALLAASSSANHDVELELEPQALYTYTCPICNCDFNARAAHSHFRRGGQSILLNGRFFVFNLDEESDAKSEAVSVSSMVEAPAMANNVRIKSRKLLRVIEEVGAAEMFFGGQAGVALAKGIPIQWCFCTPMLLMWTLNAPAVTNFRVSYDFYYGGSWDIGRSSLIVWAMGGAPSMDFMTRTSPSSTR